MKTIGNHPGAFDDGSSSNEVVSFNQILIFTQ